VLALTNDAESFATANSVVVGSGVAWTNGVF
jgi:hypothetical protein